MGSRLGAGQPWKRSITVSSEAAMLELMEKRTNNHNCYRTTALRSQKSNERNTTRSKPGKLSKRTVQLKYGSACQFAIETTFHRGLVLNPQCHG